MSYLNELPIHDHSFEQHKATRPISRIATGADRRSHERIATNFHATAFCHDRFQSVLIKNISSGGLMMSNAFGLAVGDYVVISTLTGHPYSGRIAWSVAPYTGLAFTTPISAEDPLFNHRLKNTQKAEA